MHALSDITVPSTMQSRSGAANVRFHGKVLGASTFDQILERSPRGRLHGCRSAVALPVIGRVLSRT